MTTELLESRWLERGHKFLRTLARNGVVRGLLLRRGLTEKELQRGWDLFAAASGFTSKPDTAEGAASVALGHLEAWDGPNFADTEATLAYRTPAAHAYLMQGLVAGEGPDAVVRVRRYIDRVIALREGTPADVPAAEAKEAVRLLAERKIFDESIEKQLFAWIAATQLGAAPRGNVDEKAEAVFIEYRNWLNEWREIARTSVTQRSHLIALGLASRRRVESGETTAQVPQHPTQQSVQQPVLQQGVEAAPVSVH